MGGDGVWFEKIPKFKYKNQIILYRQENPKTSNHVTIIIIKSNQKAKEK